MAGPDYDTEIKQLRATMSTIEQVLDLDSMRKEIDGLGVEVAAPDLWDDQANATRVTGRLSSLQGEVDRVTELAGRVDDLEIMVQLGQEEGDASTLADAESELAKIKKTVEALEVRTLLSGEYDVRDALITVRSGAGGVDAADFTEMLMRMYTRWAEQHDYPVEVFDTSYAEEAGLKSATFAIHGRYVYGTLSVEAGTHRLVGSARSTTRAAGRPASPRSRWCRCSSRPTTSRSPTRRSAPTSTARPAPAASRSTPPTRRSGSPTSRPASSASCQNEKSQLENKASAMVILKAKLLALKKAEEAAQMKELKGDVQASWATRCATTSSTRTRSSRTCAPATRSATRAPSSTATSTASSRPASAGVAARSARPRTRQAQVPAARRGQRAVTVLDRALWGLARKSFMATTAKLYFPAFSFRRTTSCWPPG